MVLYSHRPAAPVPHRTADGTTAPRATADICGLAAGTRIATNAGDCPIDRIRAGDRVLTRDSGYRPVLWAGPAQARPGLPPRCAVVIAADAFGAGMPSRPLRVAPGNRMLLASPRLMLIGGEAEMFAAARLLIDGHGVTASAQQPRHAYHQLMFAEHEVMLAEDVWTESLFAGDPVATMRPALHHRLRALAAGRHLSTARGCLSEWELRSFRRPAAMAVGAGSLAA